jgi:hypothetical protein
MKRYQGTRMGQVAEVTVNDQPLNPRLDLRNHSPNGFEWGYGGSGPAQLALAIMADYLADDDKALSLYQLFKWQVIAILPHQGWSLTSSEIEERVQSFTT